LGKRGALSYRCSLDEDWATSNQSKSKKLTFYSNNRWKLKRRGKLIREEEGNRLAWEGTCIMPGADVAKSICQTTRVLLQEIKGRVEGKGMTVAGPLTDCCFRTKPNSEIRD